jgi:hypothetical protein
MKQEIARVLKEEGYIYHVDKAAHPQGLLDITLKYDVMNISVIQGLRKISTPGKRQYVSCKKMPKVLDGAGVRWCRYCYYFYFQRTFNRSTVPGGTCRGGSTLLCLVGCEER